jgi:hypothetical protein
MFVLHAAWFGFEIFVVLVHQLVQRRVARKVRVLRGSAQYHTRKKNQAIGTSPKSRLARWSRESREEEELTIRTETYEQVGTTRMPCSRAWAKAASQSRAASPCPRLLRGTYVCTTSITAGDGMRYSRNASPSGVSNLPAPSRHMMLSAPLAPPSFAITRGWMFSDSSSRCLGSSAAPQTDK